MNVEIEQCEGFKKLTIAVEKDENESPGFHDYRGKLNWVIERAKHYSEKTGLEASEILNQWEKNRDYWYMNYYQDTNMPKIIGESIKVFETLEELRKSINNQGFRCPACNGVSQNPYECDSGIVIDKKGVCDWKSYGLLGTLCKGVYVFVKSEVRGQNIFKPIAWESVESGM